MADIEIRGGASAEELAALLAALNASIAANGGDGRDRADGYARWRRDRRRALAGVNPGKKVTRR